MKKKVTGEWSESLFRFRSNSLERKNVEIVLKMRNVRFLPKLYPNSELIIDEVGRVC